MKREEIKSEAMEDCEYASEMIEKYARGDLFEYLTGKYSWETETVELYSKTSDTVMYISPEGFPCETSRKMWDDWSRRLNMQDIEGIFDDWVLHIKQGEYNGIRYTLEVGDSIIYVETYGGAGEVWTETQDERVYIPLSQKAVMSLDEIGKTYVKSPIQKKS